LAIASGCSGNDPQAREAGAGAVRQFSGKYPIKVVCTIGQVAEMVNRIGGDHVQVDALMGPGVDPHLYSPVTGDVRKLAAADAIFYSGLHLEGRMVEMFEELAHSKATFAVTSGLVSRGDNRLRMPKPGLYDPHVWHDPLLWSDCVDDVALMLAKFDPTHAAEYEQNAATYRAEITALDKECRDELAAIPKERRVLVTAHDAFEYFGARYDIEVFGLKGISTEDEKDLKQQEAIQKMLVERRIPAVFVESAVAPRTVKALVEPAQAAGLDLKIGGELYADALGPADSDAATYEGMIRHNVRTIAEALR
jgi:manganese/zinc/iron transport system substrate-binding protein